MSAGTAGSVGVSMNRIVRTVAVVLSLAVCTACNKPAPPKKAVAPGAGPQTRATVVTIRTSIKPSNKTYTHTVVIANGKARTTDEHDEWRLFDTNARTVTFVDDSAKTIRREPLANIVRDRRAALAGTLPPHYPNAQVTRGGSKAIQGRNAQRTVIQLGAYRRELWLGDHHAIPGELFGMMQASDSPSSPLAPMMRAVDEALMSARGFPLEDHAELPYGKTKLVIDRQVVSIAEQNVAAGMLSVPKDYKDVTPRAASQNHP